MRDAAEAQRAAMAYKQALENAVRSEELIVSHFAMLANELARQGQPEIADMLRYASHQHRAYSMTNCALIIALDPRSGPTLGAAGPRIADAAGERVRLGPRRKAALFTDGKEPHRLSWAVSAVQSLPCCLKRLAPSGTLSCRLGTSSRL
jgi:hypothetical protein